MNPLLDKANFLKSGKTQWIFVFLIALLAFAIRGHLMRYELFFEFDSYLHARIIGYILQTGIVPAVDPLAYYFTQVGMPSIYLFWYLSAFLYEILFLGAAYSKANIILLVKFLPALYGALTAAAMFFLGKEIYHKKAGYVMAFIAAVTPAFVYRTLSGFFEDDCLGFLWMVIGFVFIVRAFKSRELNRGFIFNSIMAGLFFAAMGLSWDMFLLIPIILVPFFAVALLRVVWLKTKKELALFAGALAIAIIIMHILTVYVKVALGSGYFDWISRVFNYANQALGSLLPFLIIGVIAVICLYFYLAFSSEKDEAKKARYSKIASLILALILIGSLIMTLVIFVTKDRIFEVTGVLGASVGEESTGWQAFGQKYNALLVLPVLALILLPIRMWREKNDYLSIMLFMWILITLVMAWYKLKFTFVFGLAVAPAAGVVAAELFHYIKNRQKLEKAIVLSCLGFLLLTGLASGITFAKTNIPNIEYSMPDWKAALEFIRTQTPQDAKMFNWWNQGHWISFIGERAVLNDNRNMSKESDQDFALFAITNDLNQALGIVKTYKSDYVVFDMMDLSSVVSMGQYAFDTINIEDPRIIPYRNGPSQAIPCSVSGNSVSCGGNTWPMEEWAKIPATWQSQPNYFYEQRVSLFLYRDSESAIFYVMNLAANNSTMARLWFSEAEAMKYFPQVYSKQGVKIFRINNEAIAQAIP